MNTHTMRRCYRCGKLWDERMLVGMLPCGDLVCAGCLNKSIDDGLHRYRVRRIRKTQAKSR